MRVMFEHLGKAVLARLLDGRRLGYDAHAGGDNERTGSLRHRRAVDFDQAEAAACLLLRLATGWQIRMRTQCRDVNTGGARRLQYRRARPCLNRLAVDMES